MYIIRAYSMKHLCLPAGTHAHSLQQVSPGGCFGVVCSFGPQRKDAGGNAGIGGHTP